VFSDWASLVLPVNAKVLAAAEDLDVRRLVFYWPALKLSTPERIQERLQTWKYGRALVELALWTVNNETRLRPQSKDPISTIRSRDQIIESFSIVDKLSDANLYSPFETEWMNALELWTNEKAVKAVQVLDLISGKDAARDAALKRRGLRLGEGDSSKASAADLLTKAKLEGPALGRELKKLNREILLRK
jgi:hypothetical protein